MKINISHIAKLANLTISPNEKTKLEKQLEETIDYVTELNQINTQDIQSTNQVTGLENITREDVALSSLSQEDALSNTKSKHNGFFKVDAVLKDNE